ncbi:MAG: phosphotransferase, partial [Chloroflexota bacterium]
AQVTALEIEQADGTTKKRVVRLHGAADLKRNPQIAADEFRLLTLLQSAGIAAPKPYYVDSAAEIFATPCIVIDYIEGESDFAPANLEDHLRQFAAALAQIHQIDASNPQLSFLPQHDLIYADKLKLRPAQLDDSLDEGRIRDTLEAVWPLAQNNAATLLHGDYWPGNLLWQAGKLAAVIDWEDALLGDPLLDLGNSRLEILWAFGEEAMERFTDHYQAALPSLDFAHLPYWDLCAALRPASRIGEWAGDAITERKMRVGHKQFITQAFDALAR